jgi:hypothetical protein
VSFSILKKTKVWKKRKKYEQGALWDVVSVAKAYPLVLLVLSGAQLELLLHTVVVSRNLAELHQPEVSRTHLPLLLR